MIALDNPKRVWTQGEKTLGLAILCLGYVAMEIVAGSGLAFATLVGVYVATTAFAIRSNGGLKTVFGFLILWQAAQTVLFSQIARAMMGKSPESRLDAPIPTILCEILTVLGYALAGLVVSRIRINRDRPLFPPITNLESLRRLALVATLLSCVRLVASSVLGAASGPLHMLTALDPLAVSAAIGYSVLQSGGKRLLSPLLWFVLGPIVFFAIAGGGRGGMMYSVESVVLAGWIFGYRFRLYQYVLALVGLLVMVFIISPYSLAARVSNRSPDLVQNINTSLDILGKVVADPIKYQYWDKKDIDAVYPEFLLQDYYEIKPGNAFNLLNRFGLIRTHDMIIDDVFKSGTTGFANIAPEFDYLLPTFLTPNKGYQIWANGNALSHRVKGLVMEGDHTTGISMGIPPDAFSAFGWLGVLILPCAGFLMLILSQKLISRLDMSHNVFGLASAIGLILPVSEGTVANFISGATYNALILVVAFFLATRASRLLDFRYLRPKVPAEPWAGENPGALA